MTNKLNQIEAELLLMGIRSEAVYFSKGLLVVATKYGEFVGTETDIEELAQEILEVENNSNYDLAYELVNEVFGFPWDFVNLTEEGKDDFLVEYFNGVEVKSFMISLGELERLNEVLTYTRKSFPNMAVINFGKNIDLYGDGKEIVEYNPTLGNSVLRMVAGYPDTIEVVSKAFATSVLIDYVQGETALQALLEEDEDLPLE